MCTVRTLVRKPHDAALGSLVPGFKAEVGDIILVTSKDKHGFSTNMRPQGLQLADVLPGRSTVYVWKVPARSGLATNDLSTVAWEYQSMIDGSVQQSRGLARLIVLVAMVCWRV